MSEWEGRERVREAGRKVSRGTERGCKGQSQGKRERCVCGSVDDRIRKEEKTK